MMAEIGGLIRIFLLIGKACLFMVADISLVQVLIKSIFKASRRD